MVIKWSEPSSEKYLETIFFVPNDGVITKGTETIPFADLGAGGNVIVEYYDGLSEPLTVVRIRVYT